MTMEVPRPSQGATTIVLRRLIILSKFPDILIARLLWP